MAHNEVSAARGWRWVLRAAGVGFLLSFILSSLLRLPRALFVLGYAVGAIAFVATYAVSERVNLWTQLRRRWLAGVVGGAIFGAALVAQVLGQPGSTRATGLQLAGDLTWYGLVYGTVDALLLSVVPVIALYGSRGASALERPAARFRWAFIALLGSALVAAAYHVGFAEFRSPQLLKAIVGNVVITLAYLVTGNPLAAIVSHILMHGAAVLHGMATTVQLPPHY